MPNILSCKIDFAGVISVTRANPNGDPLNGNYPRQDDDGRGYITDVCLKRKIRNQWIHSGHDILVVPDDLATDGLHSLKDRVSTQISLKKLNSWDYKDEARKILCKKWLDVRAFGATVAYQGDAASLGVRGPVSIQMARSLDYIRIIDMGITKSTNAASSDGAKRGSDTWGSKKIIDHGAYVFYGSIFPQLAEKTGFSDADADALRLAMINMFDGDASAARPSGSMVLERLYWWRHKSKYGQYPTIKVHQSIHLAPQDQYPYFTDDVGELPGLETTIYRP